LAPGHVDDARDLGNLKDNAKFREVDKHVTGEIEATAGGDDVTEVPCAHSPPVQLTAVQGKATSRLVTVFTRIPPSLEVFIVLH